MKKIFAIISIIALASSILIIPSFAEEYLDRSGWTFKASSEISWGLIDEAFDGKANTCWHTFYKAEGSVVTERDKPPHTIEISLPKAENVSGIAYLPRQDNQSGHLLDFEVYISSTGNGKGEKAATVTISDLASMDEVKTNFGKTYLAKKITIVVTKSVGDIGACAEFNFMGGTDGVSSSSAVCYVGSESNTYESVDEAIRAKAGDVYLLSDAKLDCYKNYYGSEVAIYGNGHTLKLEAKWNIDLGSDVKLYNITVDLNQKSIGLSGAKLTLGNGATLKNGIADNGGAVLLYSAGENLEAILTMESGSLITDCKANYSGGGVHAHNGIFNMNGGKISNCIGGGIKVPKTSKVKISGDAEVTGNKDGNGQALNVSANEDASALTFEGKLTKKIGVTNNLAVGEKIANAVNLSGAENIVLDPEEAYIGKADGDKVVWTKNSNSTAKAPGDGYVPKTGWKIEASSEFFDSAPRMIDGNTKTYWHSNYRAEAGSIVEKDELPFIIDVTLPEATVISGVEILPRQGDNPAGLPTRVKYYAEQDGEWVLLFDASYPRGESLKRQAFARNIEITKFRIEFVEAVQGFGTLAEIYFLSKDDEKETVTAKELVVIEEKEALYPLDKSQASVAYDYDWWGNNRIEKVIDGVDASFWQVDTARVPNDFEFTVDLGEVRKMSAISYFPRQAVDMDGYWIEYSIMTSIDGVDFIIDVDHAKIAENERHFGRHYSYFEEPIEARYVKFFIHKGKGNIASCGEVDFYESYEIRNERLEAEAEEYKLTIGSKEIIHKGGTATLDVAPYIENGTTFIPLRGLLELMGAEITWISDIQRIEVKTDKSFLEFRIEDDEAFMDSVRYSMPVAPQITEGRTFIPLRFVSENLGYYVYWNGETREITITNYEQ